MFALASLSRRSQVVSWSPQEGRGVFNPQGLVYLTSWSVAPGAEWLAFLGSQLLTPSDGKGSELNYLGPRNLDNAFCFRWTLPLDRNPSPTGTLELGAWNDSIRVDILIGPCYQN